MGGLLLKNCNCSQGPGGEGGGDTKLQFYCRLHFRAGQFVGAAEHEQMQLL